MNTHLTSTRRNGAASTKTRLVLAVAAALFGSTALGAVAAPSLTTVAHPTMLSRGDAVTGALPMSQPMHVVVALKLRNKAALDAFVEGSMKSQAKGVMTPPMNDAQIVASHLPTQTQAQTVANYLTAMGFTNVKIAENRLLVTADGTAANAGRAFLTSFKQVRTHDGRIAFANNDAIRIPASLNGIVQSVLGLQNVHQLRTFATTPKALPAYSRSAAARQSGTHDVVRQSASNYYYPDEFPTIYAAASAPASSDVIVGIIAEGDVSSTITDLNHYTDSIGFARVTTHIFDIGSTSSDTSGQVEWNLDSQTIVGMAGGQIKQLNFYTMPTMTNASLVANFNTAVIANKSKIINVSLGECELGAQGGNGADAANAIFEIGVAQGQTFSVSTGDYGADECQDGGIQEASWPANSQYVVAVAGTNLVAGTFGRANPKAWASETEWTGSGGSESTYEPKPSWQTLWTGGAGRRGVADVAFDADGATGAVIYIGPPGQTGGDFVVGGTSLAAPIFAGMWSRVLQQIPKIGFAGPVIYGLNAADFHDITSGSNGIPAAVGYDLASGRGSMIFSSAIADITGNGLGNHAPTTNFSYVTTGGNVAFTDSSTDSDFGNTIASHYWKFGDGNNSADANPTHHYATPGTYSVKETATDGLGSVGNKVKSVTVSPIEMIRNNGFEAGAPGHWSMTAGVLTNNSSLAASGNWLAAIGGGSGAHTDHVNQIVTIPAGFTSAGLSFSLHTVTAETGSVAKDKLKVQVYVSGVLAATLGTYSNLDASSAYVRYGSFDLSPWIGQTVTLKFLATNNASLPTTWHLDDVNLAGF